MRRRAGARLAILAGALIELAAPAWPQDAAPAAVPVPTPRTAVLVPFAPVAPAADGDAVPLPPARDPAPRSPSPAPLADAAAPAGLPAVPPVPGSGLAVLKAPVPPERPGLARSELIGIYSLSTGRKALVRLANGEFRQVEVGDTVLGWEVSSIGRAQMRLSRNGRTRTFVLVGN